MFVTVEHVFEYVLWMQRFQNGVIGITLYSTWYEPLSDTKRDRKAAERAMDFLFGWCAKTFLYFYYLYERNHYVMFYLFHSFVPPQVYGSTDKRRLSRKHAFFGEITITKVYKGAI